MSKLTWQQFISIPNVTRIFNHGYDQCAALADHYHENVLGGAFIGGRVFRFIRAVG